MILINNSGRPKINLNNCRFDKMNIRRTGTPPWGSYDQGN